MNAMMLGSYRCVQALLFSVVVLGGFVHGAAAQATNAEAMLVITSPEAEDDCGAVVEVEGRGDYLGERHLWIFIHRKEIPVWWPQGAEVSVDDDGSWTHQVYLGQPRDIGADFEILAMWVEDELHEALNTYRKRSEETGEYRGIQLPHRTPSARVTCTKTSHDAPIAEG